MVRPIMKDVFFLGVKSVDATEADLPVAKDLLDTLAAHAEECVGMAANMIGIQKRIIVVSMGPFNVAMFNPVLLRRRGPFQTEEGCLSLSGTRPTTRYEEIEIEYRDLSFKKQRRTFSGWTAQIIQHEMDHLDGIII